MIGQHLKKLQRSPYETRVRALWIAVGVAAILIIALWLLTLKFRGSPEQNIGEAPRQIWESLRQVKNLKLNQ